MAERIAEGEIGVHVDDKAALAALHRIEAEFDKTMADIDRKEADVKIKGDLSALKKDLAEAKAMVEAAEKEMDKASNDRAEKRAKIEHDAAIARAKSIESEIKGIEGAIKSRKQENAVLDATEKRVAAVAKREEQRQKVLDAAERKRAAAARAAQRDVERLQRVKEREAASAERIRLKAERDAQRAEALRQREIAAIPKMQRRYAELAQTIDKLNTAKRKVKRDERASLVVDLKIKEAVAEMEALHQTLERVGGPIDIDVDLHPGRDFGLRLRKAFDDGMKGGGLRTAARDAGILTGIAFSAGAADVLRHNLSPKRILGGVGAGFAKFGHALGNLSNMTVRLGPFTATIRQAFVGLSLLAPIILDVVGALGSLVSVVGSATVGLAALSAGFLAGAIPAALGMGLVIKDVVQEFKSVKKAQKAYDDAVLKHGKGSDEATKKMKELRNVMHGVSETTARQVGLAQTIGKAWDKATAPAHASVWKAVGEGLQTVNDLMPQVAQRTNESMGIAERATTKWMKAIRGGEGRSILDNVMGNFNESLGPILSGLGNLAAYLARVANLASNRIPGIAKTFENWSQRILGTSDNMGELDGKIEKAFGSLKTLGKFLMASGRFLKTFFAGGTDAGNNFVQTMTNALDRWTAFLKTTEGQNKLGTFFSESVRGAQALYSVLAPVLSSFVRWAASIAPFARAFFEAAGAVGDFVSELLKATGLRGPLMALATTLGALWSINRIGGAIRAISGFTKALFGLAEAQTAVAATNVAAGAGGGVRAAENAAGQMTLFGRGASKAKGEVGAFRAAATRLIPAIGSLGTVAGGVATAGVFALAGAAAYGLVKLLGMKSADEKLRDSIKETQKAIDTARQSTADYQKSILEVDGVTRNYGKTVKSVNELKKEYAEAAAKHSKDNDKEAQYRQDEASALARLNGQLRERSRQLGEVRALSAKAMITGSVAATAGFGLPKIQQDVDNARRAIEELENRREKATRPGSIERKQVDEQIAQAEETLNMALKKRAALQGQINHGEVVMQTLGLNTMRLRKGMLQVTGDEQRALAKLASQSMRTARAVAKAFPDPRDVGRVSRVSSQAIKAGVPGSVTTKIIGDSRSAEEAIRRLRNISIPSKTMRIITDGGPKAIRTLEDIKGTKLTLKEQKIVSEGGPNVLAKLAQIKGSKLAAKILRILGDDAAARRVLARANNATVKQLTQFILRQLRNTGAEFPPPPPVTQWVRRQLSAKSARDSGPATGGMGGTGWGVPTAGTERHQSRAIERGLRGTLPSSSTGQAARGMRVSGPRAIWGEEPQHPEYVISTNPAYRESNRAFLRDAAAKLGIEMAAAGSGDDKPKDPALTNRGAAKARREARKNLRARTQPRRYKSDNLVELAIVEKRKREEDNFRDIVQREATFLDKQEPDTLLKETGKDADGNKLYAVDDVAVKTWNDKLLRMAARFDQLVAKVRKTLEAVMAAMHRIGDPYHKAAPGSVIGNARHNINQITELLDQQKGIRNKAKTRAGRQRAEERIRVYETALSNERQKISDATSDWKSLDEERNDIGNKRRGRIAEATDVANQYRSDAGALANKATADAVASNPEADTGNDTNTSTPALTSDQQAQLDQANEIKRLYGPGGVRNTIAESALAAFTSSGDIGSGNYASAYMAALGQPLAAVASAGTAAGLVGARGSTGVAPVATRSEDSGWQTVSGAPVADLRGGSSAPNITIQTLHPADPATLTAIGQAATAGLGFQGFRDNPRDELGY